MSKSTKTAAKIGKAEHRRTAKVANKRDTAVMRAVGKASDLADQPPLIAVSVATLFAGAVLRNSRMLRTGGRMLASHLLATGAKTLLKQGVDRARPAAAIANGRPKLGKGTGADDTALNSFPSGHTAGAVAVAEAVAADVPAAALPARLAAGAVGAVQMPRGKHYVTDVIAGAAIGWLAERIAGAAISYVEGASRRLLAKRADTRDAAEAEAHPS